MESQFIKNMVYRNWMACILATMLLVGVIYDQFMKEANDDDLSEKIKSLELLNLRISDEKSTLSDALETQVEMYAVLAGSIAELENDETASLVADADLDDDLLGTIESLRGNVALLEEENSQLKESISVADSSILDTPPPVDVSQAQFDQIALELEGVRSANKELQDSNRTNLQRATILNVTLAGVRDDLEKPVYVKDLDVDFERCISRVKDGKVCLNAFVVKFEFSRSDSSSIELVLREPKGREFATHRFRPAKSSVFRFTNEEPEIDAGEYGIVLIQGSENIYESSIVLR